MKNIIVLSVLLIVLTGCGAINTKNDNIDELDNPVDNPIIELPKTEPVEDSEPEDAKNNSLTENSEQEIHASSFGDEFKNLNELIEARKRLAQNSTENNNDMPFIYVPLKVPESAVEQAVIVQDQSAWIDYSLNGFKPNDVYENLTYEEWYKLSGSNIYMFVWTRQFNGKALLEDMVERIGLKPYGTDGKYFYSDEEFPSDSGDILRRNVFWEQDGYMFNITIPIEYCKDDSFLEYAQGQRIDLP